MELWVNKQIRTQGHNASPHFHTPCTAQLQSKWKHESQFPPVHRERPTQYGGTAASDSKPWFADFAVIETLWVSETDNIDGISNCNLQKVYAYNGNTQTCLINPVCYVVMILGEYIFNCTKASLWLYTYAFSNISAWKIVPNWPRYFLIGAGVIQINGQQTESGLVCPDGPDVVCIYTRVAETYFK